MKIKKSQLKQIIKEELEAAMDEGIYDKFKKFVGLDFDHDYSADEPDKKSSYKTPEEHKRERKEKLEQEYNMRLYNMEPPANPTDWLVRHASGEISGPYATLDSVEINMKRRRAAYLAKQEPSWGVYRSADPSLDSDFVYEKKSKE